MVERKRKLKLVDCKKYCMYLTDPPVADEEYHYQTGAANKLYNCVLTGNTCVAMYLEDKTTYSDVFAYARPYIDMGKVRECVLHSLPLTIAKQVITEQIGAERDRKVVELEKRLEQLK